MLISGAVLIGVVHCSSVLHCKSVVHAVDSGKAQLTVNNERSVITTSIHSLCSVVFTDQHSLPLLCCLHCSASTLSALLSSLICFHSLCSVVFTALLPGVWKQSCKLSYRIFKYGLQIEPLVLNVIVYECWQYQ